MRMLMKVAFDTKTANKAIKDDHLGKILKSALEHLKPEAAYFVAEGGKRTGYIVFDLADASDIPSAAEPFFAGLDAAIEITPAMTGDEVAAGLGRYVKSL